MPLKNFNKEIENAVLKVLRSGNFILGKELEQFEKEVAKFLKVKYAVGVSSGTQALTLAIKSLDIKTGDEVITTPFTFIATIEAILEAGARPVFIDIDDRKLIDIKQIDEKICEKTKVILPVHLFGIRPDTEKITKIASRHGICVVEDMAQSFNLSLKGNIGCLSFYPSKILSACGDAGMVITNDKKIADKVRMLRNHGRNPHNKYEHLIVGTNARMDEIQAAILRVKLKHFLEILKNYKGWQRDEKVYYPISCHLQPALKFLGYKKGDFPMAENYAKKIKQKKVSKLLREL